MEVRPPQRRWLPRLPQQAADALLGMLVTLVQLGLLLGVRPYEGGQLGYAEPGVLAVLLVAAQGLPLAWRRRRPLLALAAVLAANTAYYALGFPQTGFDLALPVAVYSAAAYTGPRSSLLAAVATMASFVALYALEVGPFWASVPPSFLAWLLAIFAALWTTATARAGRPRPAAATAWSGCASGSPCSAATCRPARSPRAASRSTPASRWARGHEHPRPARRRSGPVRAGFRMVLEAQPDIEVAGEAADGRQAVEATRRLRPDVVLTDIRMPVMDGIDATRELCGPGRPRAPTSSS
jgi:hypothetical protein